MRKHIVIANKLVRDKIPDIIKKEGRSCLVCRIPEKTRSLFLRQKLVEESKELFSCNKKEIANEIIDLMEIIDEIVKIEKIDIEYLKKFKEAKKKEKGEFNKGIYLIYYEKTDD